eukprot:CAMPEP_0179096478 /NCGR_PEP_ID=MMETSP0796-20121207/44355_1 /TAXON_ID=73915 /ORGANISM="Pyrodinium bahamense, Strain pbaha01" /LENGTH=47 /DNA_ID= /DNA_START= /DNA_END= /DNA_ORIENTATION=
MRSTKLAVAAALLLMFAPLDRTLIFSNQLRSSISEQEVLDAQQAWGD